MNPTTFGAPWGSSLVTTSIVAVVLLLLTSAAVYFAPKLNRILYPERDVKGEAIRMPSWRYCPGTRRSDVVYHESSRLTIRRLRGRPAHAATEEIAGRFLKGLTKDVGVHDMRVGDLPSRY